jgi:hypothetical protein
LLGRRPSLVLNPPNRAGFEAGARRIPKLFGAGRASFGRLAKDLSSHDGRAKKFYTDESSFPLALREDCYSDQASRECVHANRRTVAWVNDDWQNKSGFRISKGVFECVLACFVIWISSFLRPSDS